MTKKPTIAAQVKSAEIGMALIDGRYGQCEELDGAKAAVTTLQWVRDNADFVREIMRLKRYCPELHDVLMSWPGARVTDVRKHEKETVDD